MHDLYVKVMSWILGEALANSDRLKVIVAGLATSLLLKALTLCAVCSAFLTPDLVNQISVAIGGAVVLLVASLSHRDVAKPGEIVQGAAIPIATVTNVPPAA